jgi:hypothetical protein
MLSMNQEYSVKQLLLRGFRFIKKNDVPQAPLCVQKFYQKCHRQRFIISDSRRFYSVILIPGKHEDGSSLVFAQQIIHPVS